MKTGADRAARLGQLAQALSPDAHRLLLAVTAAAYDRALAAYLVGGAVRDFLLDRPIGDLDVVVVGDAPALAVALATQLGGSATTHPAFLTAVLTLPDSPLSVDLITARSETYTAPGALPTVRAATLAADLARRDYSVNALALALTPDGGALLDPLAGAADLAAGVLRVLHAASFWDDPTRILRGARLAARLGLTPEPQTAALLQQAVANSLLALVTPQRLWAELRLLWVEPDPAGALRWLAEWGALPQLDPALRWWPELAAQIAAARAVAPELVAADAAACAVALLPATDAARAALIKRMALSREEVALLLALGPAQARLAALPADAPPSAVDAALHDLPPAAVAAALTQADPARAALARHFLRVARGRRPQLGGDALRMLGVPPGPRYAALLRELRAAALDGVVTSVDDEWAWLRRQIAR